MSVSEEKLNDFAQGLGEGLRGLLGSHFAGPTRATLLTPIRSFDLPT
jgi:hypothetical protein